ncbi:NRDE family protein [Chitinophaga japonensis]|uniref:Tubulin-tyrosine ligase family protein n=1 Tax=Chitinophaga japonensis TaxID=104662 RepID=A0A562T3K3_CHIJA|nr:NRDE family protein [Chitinophaga japonensis]TWI87888.1 tubulin-tyrosine ligase family protein [Chitinophaga japonensis]
MCTVTFIPTAAGAYLTSNRDERPDRGQALHPEQYNVNGHMLLYPKDPEAGGTWIALKDNGDAAVLLNGAFIKHLHRPPYRRSRGLVLLDVIAETNPGRQFSAMDLEGIAPFTLVLVQQGRLWECRWDGFKKYSLALDARRPYIWSSATLYDDWAALERKRWFTDWLQEHEVSGEHILRFHQYAGNGDARNSLVMNRDNQVRTVSITSVYTGREGLRMQYRDLRSGDDVERMFTGGKKDGPARKGTVLQRCRLYVRRILTRATHWEYWPSRLVYAPLYLYWLWLSLKARSFFFFSAANLGIAYAGFAQERKSDIYRLIPQQYYPRTQLCPAGVPAGIVADQLEKKGMSFPLIAKPDMGERGVQVKLLQTPEELERYCRVSRVDFLVQEYIDHPLEAGIFYYRIPGAERGHISGIAGKEFLSVTGNGRSSIASLLEKEGRGLLQLPALRATHGAALDRVLPAGRRQTIVPYGNHSRGARFTDQGHRAGEALTNMIDDLCKQVPGFYYGRLDIRFRSWEDLAQGRHFSIIELNGAGSEPTHIYDPAHSLFFAWKEICRHWRLLYRISRLNARGEGLTLMNTAEGIKMLQEHARYLKQVEQI